jgi:hypothetical protein
VHGDDEWRLSTRERGAQCWAMIDIGIDRCSPPPPEPRIPEKFLASGQEFLSQRPAWNECSAPELDDLEILDPAQRNRQRVRVARATGICLPGVLGVYGDGDQFGFRKLSTAHIAVSRRD